VLSLETGIVNSFQDYMKNLANQQLCVNPCLVSKGVLHLFHKGTGVQGKRNSKFYQLTK
jgi:hypothetical protein